MTRSSISITRCRGCHGPAAVVGTRQPPYHRYANDIVNGNMDTVWSEIQRPWPDGWDLEAVRAHGPKEPKATTRIQDVLKVFKAN